MAKQTTFHLDIVAAAGIGLAMVLCLFSAVAVAAEDPSDAPVDLASAASFGVLGASTVTNTGPTTVSGDVGLSPGSSITGFDGAPGGTIVNGTLHLTDAEAAQAQIDTTTAFTVAASLTPQTSGMTELAGLSLTPGVYSGGALALSENGVLTLAGDAESTWVFQAASTLTIGSASSIVMTGGASACNVFWQVGSSATLGSAARFAGTVLADQSITAVTGATIEGRLLARIGAVTLDTNTITVPVGCPPPSEPGETAAPTITSGVPSEASEGQQYSFTVAASGTPSPTFTVSAGVLPPGLSLDAATGVISGTPTTAGETSVSVTAANGIGPDASADYVIVVASAPVVPPVMPPVTPPVPTPVPTPAAPAVTPSVTFPVTPTVTQPGDHRGADSAGLAVTGVDLSPLFATGAVVALLGLGLLAFEMRRRRRNAPHSRLD